jgi:hypothetical protein
MTTISSSHRLTISLSKSKCTRNGTPSGPQGVMWCGGRMHPTASGDATFGISLPPSGDRGYGGSRKTRTTRQHHRKPQSPCSDSPLHRSSRSVSSLHQFLYGGCNFSESTCSCLGIVVAGSTSITATDAPDNTSIYSIIIIVNVL